MEDIAGVFLVIYLLVMLFSSVFGIVSYVLTSLGLYTIADRRGIKYPWMAWLPVVNVWILGCISDQYQQVAKGKKKSKRKALLALQIVMYVLMFVLIIAAIFMMIQSGSYGEVLTDSEVAGMMGPVVMMALSYFGIFGVAIAYTIVYYFALYDLYVSCKPDSGVLYIVLTIVLSVTMPFLIFSCRKKDLGMQPPQPAPVYSPNPVYQQPMQPQQPAAQPGAPTWHSVQSNPYQPTGYQPPVYQPQVPVAPQYEPPVEDIQQ